MQAIKARAIRWCLVLSMMLATGHGRAASAQDANMPSGPDERRITLLQAKPRAYAIVEATARDPWSRVRLVGLEAAQHAPDAVYNLALSGLTDEDPIVRFAALVTIGKLKVDRLADAALDLSKDKNASVRAAAIFAAKRCGRDVDLSPLGAMLGSSNSSSRANAAMLIGQLGDRQAMPMLRELAAKPMPRVSTAERASVRLQFAEAMIRLDPDDLEVLGSIRAAMFSNYDDVRILAISVIGEIDDRSQLKGLAHIIERDNPIQVKIAAAQAMVRMGDSRGQATLMQASRYDVKALRSDLEKYLEKMRGIDSAESRELRALLADDKRCERNAAEVRAQAAIALSWVNTQAAAERLTAMLEDPDKIVQVAAASGVLRASR